MSPPLDLDVDEVLSTTRTVRRRLDLERPVSEELVDECLELALQAPTGGNRQQWRFVVVRDAEIRAEIARLYRQAFETAYLGGATDVRRSDSPVAGPDRRDRVFDSVAHLAHVLADVPVLVIPCLPGRAETWTTPRVQAGRWGSVLPAVWSFMLAARSRGLGTAWTTMHLTYEREVAEVLGIPYDDVTQAALIPVAHTVGLDFRPAGRAPLATVVHRDRWPT